MIRRVSMSKATVTVAVRGRSSRFVLREGELATIGRADSCAIPVQDQSVSREHCVAILTGGRIRLNDLQSTHGILFDGKRVEQCELGPGDRCKLGNAVFVFGDGAQQAPSAAAAKPEPETVREPQSVSQPQPEPASPREPTPPAALSPPAEGVQIAGYRIIEALGEGGYGIVYRAQQVRLDREVALKVLKYDTAATDSASRIDAFQHEARAAAAINDPRLVQVFDVGQDHGHHYLSMELVSGGSLARKLRRSGPMEWREAMALIRDLALALKAAHACGLVHRDVKPANILLTGGGQAKLTDLGLATGEIAAGTVAFMAPEQLMRREVDARADIYALGCTAYAALSGRPPFTGSKEEVAKAHVRQTPESLMRLGITVPWHLEQLVIDSMMAKDPADRPQNAVELLERLDRVITPDTGVRTQVSARAAARRTAEDSPRVRLVHSGGKALSARILSELIVFAMIGSIVIAALLALKYGWPGFDIYRLIGK